MRIKISRLSVPTLPDTEEGTKEGGGKPLYQPGLAIHPTLQKLPPVASNAISTPATPGQTTIPDPNKLPYYPQVGNACGTTTLAEIMSYLGAVNEPERY